MQPIETAAHRRVRTPGRACVGRSPTCVRPGTPSPPLWTHVLSLETMTFSKGNVSICGTQTLGSRAPPPSHFATAPPQGAEGGGGGAPLTRKRHIPPHSAQPQHTNDGAPRTRKRHQQEHRPQRPTERSDPTQHEKGRAGDCPGPRKETTQRDGVSHGGCQSGYRWLENRLDRGTKRLGDRSGRVPRHRHPEAPAWTSPSSPSSRSPLSLSPPGHAPPPDPPGPCPSPWNVPPPHLLPRHPPSASATAMPPPLVIRRT